MSHALNSPAHLLALLAAVAIAAGLLAFAARVALAMRPARVRTVAPARLLLVEHARFDGVTPDPATVAAFNALTADAAGWWTAPDPNPHGHTPPATAGGWDDTWPTVHAPGWTSPPPIDLRPDLSGDPASWGWAR